MKRWWTLPAIPAVVFGLGLPISAPASTHCTVSIIMTTLGTDGTAVSQTITVPPNSKLEVQTGEPKPADSVVSNPPATNNSNPGSSGGSGGSGGGANGNTPQTTPTAATSNPDDTVISIPPESDTIPVPSDGSDEPTPPEPPILVPDPPTNDNGEPTDTPTVPDDSNLPPTTDPTNGGGVAEAPEPGTLTLLGLAAIGGMGYVRKKRKTA